MSLAVKLNSADAEEIIACLSSKPRTLPCRLFYDDRGAELFEEITRTEAYYPTRAETQILREHAGRIADFVGPHAHVVELGSGSGIKSQLLLDALRCPAAYTPVDVSRKQLLDYAARMRAQRPQLTVLPLCADYTREFTLPKPPRPAASTVAFFPGSTIGNFEPHEAKQFLKRIRKACGTEGGLVIGVDLKKDRATLDVAYNDPQGVTAEFNKNILLHVNRIADADFDVDKFEHSAFYNESQGRIEMHLISTTDQDVRIGATTIRFETGEGIVTEHSYKYSTDEFADMVSEAGFHTREVMFDTHKRFSVFLLG